MTDLRLQARLLPALLLASLVGLVASAACGPTTGASGADFASEEDTDLSRRTDGAVAKDFSFPDLAPPCPTIAEYCSDPSNPCVTAWPAANSGAAWCSGTRTFNILPESAPCPSGDHLVVLSNEIAFGSRYFVYRGDSLIGIIGFPDDDSTGICLAGDATLSQADVKNCPPNDTVVQCVDGAIQ